MDVSLWYNFYSFLNGYTKLSDSLILFFEDNFIKISLSNNSIIYALITEVAYYENNNMYRERFCPKADSIILVYDITKRYTFEECKNYYCNLINKFSKRNVKVILIGNKSDLKDKREISYEEALNFADSNNYYYIETSCVQNKNVFEVFERMIIEVYKDIKEFKEKQDVINLQKINTYL